MPSGGQWTSGERTAVNEHVKATFSGCADSGIEQIVCPTCSTNSYGTECEPWVVGIAGQGILGTTIGAARDHAAQLTCQNCGHVILISNTVGEFF